MDDEKISSIMRDGKSIILAYDHGLEHGPKDFKPLPESADPKRIFEIAKHDSVSALAVQKGLAEQYYHEYEDDVPLLVKLNGTSDLWDPDDYYSPLNCSVEYAVEELGADAVGFTMYAGSDFEGEMFEQFRFVQEQAHSYGVPVIMWAYPRGRPLKNAKTPEIISYAARIGLELGADMVKCKYPGSKEGWERIEEVSGRMKTVMSGGAKTSDRNFLENVRSMLEAGGDGIAVGRNVFQRENPEKILDKLEKVIYEEKPVGEVV